MMDKDDWRDFNDIERYREILVGKTIKTVDLVPEYDEGLDIVMTDGAWLRVVFSGCEGFITVKEG